MPTVGKGKKSKKFPYTKAGKSKAKVYTRKTGKKMRVKKGY